MIATLIFLLGINYVQAASLSVSPTSSWPDTNTSLTITISPESDVFYWGVYDPSGNMTDIGNLSQNPYSIYNPVSGPGHPTATGIYHIILIDSSQSGWPNNCDGLSPYTGTYSSCIASAGYAGVDYSITVGSALTASTTATVFVDDTNIISLLAYSSLYALLAGITWALMLFWWRV